jgi:hypothetical protein
VKDIKTLRPVVRPNPKMPKRLMRKIGDSVSEVRAGNIVVDVKGKTYYVESFNDMTNRVSAVSTCEKHYFVSFPANIFGLYWADGE